MAFALPDGDELRVVHAPAGDQRSDLAWAIASRDRSSVLALTVPASAKEEEDGGDQSRRRRRGGGAQHPGRAPAAPVEVGEVEEVGEAQDQVGHREAPSEDPESGEAAGGGDLVHVASHRWCTVTSTGGAPSCSRATAS